MTPARATTAIHAAQHPRRYGAVMRALCLVPWVLGVLTATGCSTIIRPTKPDAPLTADGAPLAGLRFDGEETTLREPGMPLAPSRAWTREVQNYAASSLNTVLSTSDAAPSARTIVSFDMGSPSAIQLGPWKDLTITITSTLPDGAVVRSKPVSGYIDDPLESAAMAAANVGNTVLNVVGTAAIVLFFVTQPPPDPTLGIVAIGSLVGGVALSAAQSGGQFFIAAAEERRWSNLFASALAAHAADVRRAAATPRAPESTTPSSPRAARPPPPTATPDPSDVPPLLETSRPPGS